MALGFGTVGAVLLLFTLSALLNPLLKWLRPAWGLERGELLLVYIMMGMSSPIPTIFVSQWLSQITVPFYYAPLENEWVQWLHPHIPGWMMSRDLVTQQPFYEGMGADYAVPWRAWLPVLLMWQPFIWALFLVMIASMSSRRAPTSLATLAMESAAAATLPVAAETFSTAVLMRSFKA